MLVQSLPDTLTKLAEAAQLSSLGTSRSRKVVLHPRGRIILPTASPPS